MKDVGKEKRNSWGREWLKREVKYWKIKKEWAHIENENECKWDREEEHSHKEREKKIERFSQSMCEWVSTHKYLSLYICNPIHTLNLWHWKTKFVTWKKMKGKTKAETFQD